METLQRLKWTQPQRDGSGVAPSQGKMILLHFQEEGIKIKEEMARSTPIQLTKTYGYSATEACQLVYRQI